MAITGRFGREGLYQLYTSCVCNYVVDKGPCGRNILKRSMIVSCYVSAQKFTKLAYFIFHVAMSLYNIIYQKTKAGMQHITCRNSFYGHIILLAESALGPVAV